MFQWSLPLLFAAAICQSAPASGHTAPASGGHTAPSHTASASGAGGGGRGGVARLGTALQFGVEVAILSRREVARSGVLEECRWTTHPGVELRANLKSISHRCHLFEVAFVWELTKETIHLPLGCIQGGCGPNGNGRGFPASFPGQHHSSALGL